MPSFEYVAITPQGKSTKGSLDAENERVARQKLRGQGFFPTELRESTDAATPSSRDVSKYFQTGRVSIRDLAVATRQVATLLTAGLPLVSALQALAEQTDSVLLKRTLVDVREGVEEGSSLARALGKTPKIFPSLYINMVAAGEASGTLDTVMENLAEYLESQMELRRKVRGALMYPTLMLCFCTLVTVVLFIFVVPSVVDIFKKQGATLPLPTIIMIGISNFLVHYWYLLIAVVASIPYAVRSYYKTNDGRRKIDHWALRAPIFGGIYVKIATARISKTLGTLVQSGVGLLSAIDITKNIVNNIHVQEALDKTRDGVREGRSLANELNASGIFPSMLSRMVAVGEKSGQLENMLLKAGKSYENDVNATLSGLTTLLEPIMMFFVGGIVLLIVISVLLPMADLINVIGN